MTEPRPPDVYPPVHNLLDRWGRNENFVGREDAIRNIEQILRDHGAAVVRSEPSLPVSGKTAMAIEYAHRHHIHYDVVWVFDCLDPLGLAAQQALLGDAMREQGIADGRRLLVFDGVDGDPAGFRRWYPDISVDLLFTARQPGGGRDEYSVTLGPLDRRYSVLLLVLLAPMLGWRLADTLADLLAGQPALLWEVGRYIAAGDVAAHACPRLLTMLLPPDGPGARPQMSGHRVPGSAGLAPGVQETDDREPGRGRIALQELVELAEWLERVEFIADQTSKQTWLALIEEQSGQPVRLGVTTYIRTFMINLLQLAAKQPTPDVLVAIADAAGALGPGDPNVERVRAAVEVIRTRW